MIHNPNCPYCDDTELEWDDNGDTCFEGDFMTVKSFGHCPHCKRNFIWEDVYEYDSFQNLEEE